MTQAKVVAQVVRQLRELDVRVAIDDFGTGYSTIGVLADLEVDAIKIDQRYIRDLTASPFSYAVVRRIIQAANDLDIQTIAEGVETEEIYDALADLGCDIAQGYYLSAPLPPDEFTAWAGARNAEQGKT